MRWEPNKCSLCQTISPLLLGREKFGFEKKKKTTEKPLVITERERKTVALTIVCLFRHVFFQTTNARMVLNILLWH